jgi:putative transposase
LARARRSWRLPEGDADYSTRVSLLKKRFTERRLSGGGGESSSTPSRRRHRVRGVWQKRFYEHTIRGYRDYKAHLGYIHMNPVKHGLATKPADWPWSTFKKFVSLGEYEDDWAGPLHQPGGIDIEPDAS